MTEQLSTRHTDEQLLIATASTAAALEARTRRHRRLSSPAGIACVGAETSEPASGLRTWRSSSTIGR